MFLEAAESALPVVRTTAWRTEEWENWLARTDGFRQIELPGRLRERDENGGSGRKREKQRCT